MTLHEELVEAVRTMREHQRAYFRDRSPARLELSKAAERAVDRLLERLAAPTGDLFGGGGGSAA